MRAVCSGIHHGDYKLNHQKQQFVSPPQSNGSTHRAEPKADRNSALYLKVRGLLVSGHVKEAFDTVKAHSAAIRC